MIPYLVYNLQSYFVISSELFLEPFFFLMKDLKSLLYLVFKGHNISLSRRALFFPSNISMSLNLTVVISVLCVLFFLFPCTLLYVTVVLFFTFYITIASVRDWGNIILFFLLFFFLCLWTNSTVNSFLVLSLSNISLKKKKRKETKKKKKKKTMVSRNGLLPPLHIVSASRD